MIDSEMALALIEMGAIDACFAASAIEELQASFTTARFPVYIYNLCIENKEYDILETLVNACPAVFRDMVVRPFQSNSFYNDFIANVVIRCCMNVNAVVADKRLTILMWVCKLFLVESVQFLLTAGADNRCIRYDMFASSPVGIDHQRTSISINQNTISKVTNIINMLLNGGIHSFIRANCYGLVHGMRTAKEVFQDHGLSDLAQLL